MKKSNSNFDKIKTNKGLFEVEFKSSERMPYYLSKENKHYICGKANTAFTISIESKAYKYQLMGAKLFIDGNLVIRKKIFKTQGTFFGFHCGNGKYKEFVLDIPEVGLNKNNKSNEEFGTIKIQFYRTIIKNFKSSIYKNYSNEDEIYLGSKREDDKKFYLRTLTIRQGNLIESNNNYKNEEKIKNLGVNTNSNRENSFTLFSDEKEIEDEFDKKFKYTPQTHKKYGTRKVVLDDKIIDEVVVHYVDFLGLQIQGLISLNNIEHLYMIPDSQFNIDYCINCLKAILASPNYNKGVHISEIEDIYKKYTKRSLIEFHQNSLYEFFQTKVNEFNLNNEGILTLNNRESFRKKFCEIKFLDKNYIRKGIYAQFNFDDDDHEYLKKKKQEFKDIVNLIDD